MQTSQPRLTLALLLLGGLSGCSTLGQTAFGESPAAAAQVGSRAWWKENQSEATFVPGQGYAVAGVEGFFDEFGRPIDGGLDPSVADHSTLATFDDPLKEEKGLLGGVFSTSPVAAVKERLGPPKNVQAAEKLYSEGETHFRGKQYAAAADKFREAARRWPDSPLEERAMFMEAEAYFFDDRYPDANDGYNALVKKYINTQFLDKVVQRQFAIGRYWEQHHRAEPHWPVTPNLTDKTRYLFDTHGHALKTYENIRLNDPTGPLADDALMATANAHFLSGRYGDADYYYGELRKEYPESDYQFQAHLLGLQCKLRCYQGPDYDQTPLVEARQIAETLLTQFPTELGDQRQRIVETRQQIAASLALRDWSLAEFYAGKREYGSARYYYEQLVRDYPTTKLAEQAKERLTAYADQPAVPPNYFQWLEDVLPTNESETIMLAQPVEDETRR